MRSAAQPVRSTSPPSETSRQAAFGQAGQPSAYLKISDGCARPCTFCNIPQIKGRQFRSVRPDELVLEARELTDHGARELVLVAQDSTSYGSEWGDPHGLARLLERLAAEVPAARWLRLMYAYPGLRDAEPGRGDGLDPTGLQLPRHPTAARQPGCPCGG